MTTQSIPWKINPTSIAARICMEDYSFFVREFWSEFMPGAALVYNWHIPYVCGVLQEAAERSFRGEDKEHDVIINIPPGSTKSTIASVMFVPWMWTRCPWIRSLNSSHTESLSLDLSRKARDIILSDKYREMFPDVVLATDQNTKHEFANTHKGTRIAAGTGGSVIGRHAHHICVDDPIDPTGARSTAELDDAREWVLKTLPTRAVDKAKTWMCVIMQRLNQNDPTGALLELAKTDGVKIKHVCLPATDDYPIHPKELRGKYVDGLLDPIRLSRPSLKNQKAMLGEYGYAGQYGQSPAPPTTGMFDIQRIKLIAAPPPDNVFTEIVRFWDKAGTQGSGCRTAGFKIGKRWDAEMKLHRYTILDGVIGQWASGEREKVIFRTATADGYGVQVGIEQEPGSGGKESAENTIARLAGWRTFVDKPGGDQSKVVRAEPLAAAIYAGVVECVVAPWTREFLEELKYFPHSTFKDSVDACSGAFNRLRHHTIKVGAMTSGVPKPGNPPGW